MATIVVRSLPEELVYNDVKYVRLHRSFYDRSKACEMNRNYAKHYKLKYLKVILLEKDPFLRRRFARGDIFVEKKT